MHNKFSNFLCFASFCTHLCAISNNFNCNDENKIFRQMTPRIYRRHPLNMPLGGQELQEGSVSKIHIRCVSYAYKTISYVTDVIELKNQLSSMTSKRSHHLIELLALIGVSIQHRISLQRYHRLTM